MHSKGKGRSASKQEWMFSQMVQMASVLLLFQISSNASQGDVRRTTFRTPVLGNTAVNIALVTHWLWENEEVALGLTPGDMNYS